MIGTLTVPEGSEKSLPMWSKTIRAARLRRSRNAPMTDIGALKHTVDQSAHRHGRAWLLRGHREAGD
jgi:hypothetical protein